MLRRNVVNTKQTPKNSKSASIGSEFFERIWDESWTYIKTVVDVVHEPVLILREDLRVMAANESFYQMFQVEKSATEGCLVYNLGNGQWNIPALKKLLEDILPKNTFFKGFEVDHKFPVIGHKIMMLNARTIHSKFVDDGMGKDQFPPIILLAMENVTEMMKVAETIAGHSAKLEEKLNERTRKMELHIGALELELANLKK